MTMWMAMAFLATVLATGPAAAVSPSAPEESLAAAGFPSAILGLPVRTVAEARQLMAGGGINGRAIAVGGWWSQPVLAQTCPAPMVYVTPIEGYCRHTALAGTPAQVDSYTQWDNGSSESFMPPDDALQPRLVSETAGIQALWEGVTDLDSADRQMPQRVVIIGHVGDPRMWQCIPQSRHSCETAFVVDRFAWVEGRSVEPAVDHGGPPPRGGDDALATISAALPPGSVILTFGAWMARDAHSLDPRFHASQVGRFWFARAIVGVPDAAGTAALTEVVMPDATGRAELLDVAPPPDEIPATVPFVVSNFPRRTRVAIERLDGSVVYLQPLQRWWTPPAVLPAGDYQILVWQGRARPTPPPIDSVSCSATLHVGPGQSVPITISFDDGNCTIGPTPEPAPSPGL